MTEGEIATEGSLWSVRVVKVEAGSVFGSMRVETARRLRYIALTVEYVYLGSGRTELYPETVALVHTGDSPLQGLTAAPLIFQEPHPPAPSSDSEKRRIGRGGAKVTPLQTTAVSSSGALKGASQRGPGVRLADRSIVIPVEANTLQHATFVFEFHPDCREFCLYFPGCEGIPLDLKQN